MDTQRTSLSPLFILAFSALSLLGGCGDQNTLIVHAGAGLRPPLDEIGRMYRRAHTHPEIVFCYKGSGFALPTIERSHTGDLFIPGEEFYLLQALERGLIDSYEARADTLARFVTVIITPRGNPARVLSVRDFAGPGVRVGLGNPGACAIGLWHKKIFRRAGILDRVRKNAVFSAKCIPELGNAVQHRAVDATIVWASTALFYLKDIDIIPLPPRLTGIVTVPVALLSCSSLKPDALELKKYLLSSRARAVFRKHGYLTRPVPTDEQGFLLGPGFVDKELECLVNAARAAGDERLPLDVKRLGPFIDEVRRQRRTRRSGD